MSTGKVIALSLLGIMAVAIFSGFAGDIGRALLYRLPSAGLGADPNFGGPISLEEQILNADAIVRVKLLSISPTVGVLRDEWTGDSAYVGALEFRFEAFEYLKGSGGGEVTGIVYGNDYYESRLGALTFGEDLTNVHDTTWDNREAIVFLSKGIGMLSTLEEPDRYMLGSVGDADPAPYYDYYSIDSPHSKRWLPVADVEGASAALGVGSDSGEGEQHFLTGAERSDGESREEIIDYRVANSAHNKALGTGGDSSTITLSSLNDLIAELEAEIDAGDGTDQYVQCVVEKYGWYREVEYHASGGGYDTESHDHQLDAGSPADTVFAIGTMPFPESLDPTNYEYANPGIGIDSWLEGEDAYLFRIVDDKALVGNVRPLPEGEYRFYINSRAPKYIICDAYPDAWRTWKELVVNVSVPTDTLHEAFFDPLDIGGAVGADGEIGVLQPEWFETEEGETVIERIAWSEGQVEMELSPAAALDDHRADFIALDGSVALRLDFDAAVALADNEDVATFAWGVCEQPWADGDLLMLRIAESISNDGVAATNDPECLAALPEQIFVPAAVSTPEPTPEPTATPEPTPTAEQIVESTPVSMPTGTPIPTATPEAETSAEPMATPVPAEDDDSTNSSAPPPAPRNLAAAVNEDGSATLTWDSPDDESITGYQILRQRPTEGEDALSVYVEDTGSTDTTYIDVEVVAEIRHVYQVRAINANGASESSNSVQVGP